MKNSMILSLTILLFISVQGFGQGLKITLSVDPTESIWGHVTEFESSASGGMPDYGFAFSAKCANEAPPIFVAYANSVPPVTSWSSEFCGENTGSYIAYAGVVDDADDEASTSKAFEVLEPNKVSLEKATPATYTMVLTDNGAMVSTTGVLVKFPVKRDDTLVGPCAKGIGQENIQQLIPLPPAGQRGYMGWTTTNDQHLNFTSPNINDIKRIGSIASASWPNVQNGVLGKFNQKVRVQYEDCEGVKHWEHDPKTYTVTFEKTGPLQIKVTFE